MATYLYETIPSKPGEEPVTFEVVQSMRDAPLTTHPETGIPVRRVITGGFGFVSKGGGHGRPAASSRFRGRWLRIGLRLPLESARIRGNQEIPPPQAFDPRDLRL